MQENVLLKLLKYLEVFSVVYFQNNLLTSAHPSFCHHRATLLCSYWIQYPTAFL